MKEVLEVIVKSLVKNPDEVEIEEVIADDEKNVTLKIKVADEDMGRVIGKDGRIVEIDKSIIILGRYIESDKRFCNVSTFF